MFRLVVLGALVASCGGSSTAPAGPAPPPAVVLADSGAEPRQLLRYAPPLHTPETIEIAGKARISNAFTNTVLANATTTLKSGAGHATATVTVPLHGVAIESDGRLSSELNLLIVQHHLRITSSLTTEIIETIKRVHM